MFPPSARAIVSARKNIEYLGVQNYTIYNTTPNSSYTGNRYWNPETDDGILNDQSTTCTTSYNAESCYCCGQNPYPPYECYTCEATYVQINQASDFTLYSSLTGGYYHTSGNLNRTGWKYIQGIMPLPGNAWAAENCTYNYCTGGYASEKAYIYANNSGYFDGYGAAAEGGVRDAGSIGIKYDNTLWAWGGPNFMYWMGWNVGHKYSPYQLGTDTWSGFARTQIPTTPDMSTFLGIKTNGTLWAWGNNIGLGTLGNNSIANTLSPVQIGTGTDWKYVQYCQTSGATAALKTDGTLWMWGSNQYGQLGVGNTVNRSSPVQVGTGTNWARVMTGYYTTLAVKTDGTLWAWGYNGFGTIGDGTTTNRSSPVQIGTGTNWSKIRVGYIAANAIKTDGTLWGWSYAGRYGIASTTVKSSPVQLGGSNSDHADFINDTNNSENAITINTNKQMLQYYAFGTTTRYSAAVLAGPYYQTGDDFQLQKVSFANTESWVNILKSGTL